MNKKIVFSIVGVFLLIIIFIFVAFLHHRPGAVVTSIIPSSTPPVAAIATTTGCLPSNEYVDSQANGKSSVTSTTIDIYVKSKETGETISIFPIQNVVYQEGRAVEIYPCGVYVLEGFGELTEPGSDIQLWKYNYDGVGKELFNLFAITPQNTEENFYYQGFSLDSAERYLALEKAPGEASDSVVIDDANTLGNLYTLSLSDITKDDPSIAGMIAFEPGGWSSDSHYFWFDLFNAADVFGFVQINTSNWSYRAFAAPTTTMGGDAFNPDTGMVTYRTNAAPWTGDASTDQQYKNAATQSGQITSFLIDNLLTGKTYLVATTTDPTYYYQPKWISDSVLQYTLPSGATTTYTVAN